MLRKRQQLRLLNVDMDLTNINSLHWKVLPKSWNAPKLYDPISANRMMIEL